MVLCVSAVYLCDHVADSELWLTVAAWHHENTTYGWSGKRFKGVFLLNEYHFHTTVKSKKS